MHHDPPTTALTNSAQSLPEHVRLIGLIEHLHEILLANGDGPTVRSALEELKDLAQAEFLIEERLLCRGHPAELPAHHSEHAVLVEKLRQFRRRVDAAALDDSDRAELYDFISDWLVHALVDP
jgi:hemerythrin-like metal-binding protein